MAIIPSSRRSGRSNAIGCATGYAALPPTARRSPSGEVGLPYYTRTEAEARGEAFDEAPYLAQLDDFVRLAAELDRPIALHAVYEDADKALAILDRRGVRRAHFHWYKGSPETTARLAERGCFYLDYARRAVRARDSGAGRDLSARPADGGDGRPLAVRRSVRGGWRRRRP
ncbi:TatD family hydrolase [Cohnella rhizosphaerae]|uniref:TatD family hydrolase n=1 Tax=Cohnella rhizosphaerae TaxID=1457232 RepID=UPI0030B88919